MKGLVRRMYDATLEMEAIQQENSVRWEEMENVDIWIEEQLLALVHTLAVLSSSSTTQGWQNEDEICVGMNGSVFDSENPPPRNVMYKKEEGKDIMRSWSKIGLSCEWEGDKKGWLLVSVDDLKRILDIEENDSSYESSSD